MIEEKRVILNQNDDMMNDIKKIRKKTKRDSEMCQGSVTGKTELETRELQRRIILYSKVKTQKTEIINSSKTILMNFRKLNYKIELLVKLTGAGKIGFKLKSGKQQMTREKT